MWTQKASQASALLLGTLARCLRSAMPAEFNLARLHPRSAIGPYANATVPQSLNS